MEVTTTGQWPAVVVMTTGQWPVVEVETVKKKNRCVVLNCAPSARDGNGVARDGNGVAPVSARSRCPAKRVLALSAERLRGVRRDFAGARRAVCATCSS